MPLLQLWSSNPEAIGQFSVEQVVATAGDGNLKDGSICSHELREYFASIPTNKLASYVDQCLASSINKGGLILQDLVNELARRLDYTVTHGRYQGTASAIGFDGIWTSPDGHAIVAEVKTTDAYRISLETLATYRERLLHSGAIVGTSSILIVVGRQDTGELEAQIRGSRHAWDVRLISSEALLKLVRLKLAAEGPETGRKIRSILMPAEYTRLDGMIDVMFTAAKDLEEGAVEEAAEAEQGRNLEDEETPSGATKSGWQFTDSALLQAKREKLVAAVARSLGVQVSKQSRALYGVGEQVRIASTISKRYVGGTYPYWYAYHPHWDEYLRSASLGYLVLGCMDLKLGFSIPREVVYSYLPALNTTVRPDGERYWHIHVIESEGGHSLVLPKEGRSVPLIDYVVRLEE